MSSRHEFNFSNFSFGNTFNNPNQYNFYSSGSSAKISDFPDIQKQDSILGQINSYEVDNNYQNMMNRIQSKNNSNLNIFEENKNSSYNSNNEYFKSLLERKIKI